MANKEGSAPVWYEGMFLTPHHMQHLEAHRQQQLWALTSHLAPFTFGYKRLAIDNEALGDFNFKLLACEMVLPGGALLSMPGNLELASRSFKDALPSDGHLMVYLGVPELRPDRANLAGHEGDQSQATRYSTLEIERLDENTGDNQRKITVSQFNGRIFFGKEDRAGYECLPLARLLPGPAGAGGRLDGAYLPPALSLGAWQPLQDLAQELSSKIMATLGALRANLGQAEIGEVLGSPRGLENALKILALGGGAQVIGEMANTAGVHPQAFYLELCRLFGSLAIFAAGSPPNPPPAYRHDDPGPCFRAVRATLISLLEGLASPSYLRRSFVLRRDRMQVELQSDWVSGLHQLYLGVRGDDAPETIRANVRGVKLCAPRDLDEVKRRRLEAIALEWLPKGPSPLPSRDAIVYARITAGGSWWASVQEDLALDILGHEQLPYRFDLYVL